MDEQDGAYSIALLGLSLVTLARESNLSLEMSPEFSSYLEVVLQEEALGEDRRS